jgi:hypothetical protein
MKIFTVLAILLFLCVFCRRQEKIIASPLKFTDSLISFNGLVYNKIEEKDFKINKMAIVCLINSECGSCVEKINRWNGFLDTLNKKGVQLIVLLRTQDTMYFRKFIYPNLTIKAPSYIDVNDHINRANPFFSEINIEGPKVVLIDSKKKVRLYGDPTLNTNIKKIYLKYIEDKNNALLKI